MRRRTPSWWRCGWRRTRRTAQLRAALKAPRLRVAELERQRGSGSDDSGMPSSKEPIAARARRKAERKARRDTDTSSRERSKDKARGGQPGHPGRGLVRDPDPQQRERVDPPAECRGCGNGLDDADDAGTAWSQVWDVKVIPWRIEYLLPRRECGCGTHDHGQPAVGRAGQRDQLRAGAEHDGDRVDRVRERADRTGRAPGRDADRTGGVGRVRGQGERPPGRAS